MYIFRNILKFKFKITWMNFYFVFFVTLWYVVLRRFRAATVFTYDTRCQSYMMRRLRGATYVLLASEFTRRLGTEQRVKYPHLLQVETKTLGSQLLSFSSLFDIREKKLRVWVFITLFLLSISITPSEFTSILVNSTAISYKFEPISTSLVRTY